MGGEWVEPWEWSTGDLITAERLNRVNTNLRWLKQKLEEAPPGAGANTILEALQRFKGIWWFNNNWAPAGLLDSDTYGSGTIAWNNWGVMLDTGTTLDSYAYVCKDAYGLYANPTWDKKRWLSALVAFSTVSAQNVHLTMGEAPRTGATNQGWHIGFKLIGADLYGTVGYGGIAESTLLLETLTGACVRTLECVLTPGVECRFYVDGVDKGAITTNLPYGTTTAYRMLMAAIHNTEAASKQVYILEWRVFQEE